MGSTKEGKKQLTLILEWVAQYQLQKKQMSEAAATESLNESNPNPNYGFQCNTGFNPSPWIPPPRKPFYPIPTFMGFEGDPYCGQQKLAVSAIKKFAEKAMNRFFSSASASPPPEAPQLHPEKLRMKPQNHRKHGSVDKQSEAICYNRKFFMLLSVVGKQKVLKQSDVGNLGRIVLPKKEAESHLPKLESRDRISIAMEDIVTSRVWNMKNRFWPNNKRRMYLLENTNNINTFHYDPANILLKDTSGDFVRDNGLQEEDFIVIYADIKCSKYLIRGVKVRQIGQKADSKKPAKKNACNSSYSKVCYNTFH
ncbi:B3 domain-containing transcription factor ABI3-like [Solanum tuberosum]|uniref:B3 domain-containing transcription factor ABI3-like n=1 Tax=Solanum tuberosum TaxID=4113 RepID=UPI00073A1B47|nr:PREDICTED: B3 domain-containing transcription factor ABI3-like [Solanum tuberosum]